MGGLRRNETTTVGEHCVHAKTGVVLRPNHLSVLTFKLPGGTSFVPTKRRRGELGKEELTFFLMALEKNVDSAKELILSDSLGSAGMPAGMEWTWRGGSYFPTEEAFKEKMAHQKEIGFRMSTDFFFGHERGGWKLVPWQPEFLKGYEDYKYYGFVEGCQVGTNRAQSELLHTEGDEGAFFIAAFHTIRISFFSFFVCPRLHHRQAVRKVLCSTCCERLVPTTLLEGGGWHQYVVASSRKAWRRR